MKQLLYNLLFIPLLIILCQQAHSQQCVDLFPVVEKAALEARPSADKELLDFKMTDRELMDMSEAVAERLGITIKNPTQMRHAMYEVKSKVDHQLDSRLRFFGRSIDQTMRKMRDRRKKFRARLVKGDGYAATAIYARTFEVYYISMSKVIEYMRAPVATRDKMLQQSTTKELLMGLSQGREFRDIRDYIEGIFKNGKQPKVNELITAYDLLVSRTSAEVRFVEGSLITMEKATDTPQVIQESVAYVRNRLDPSGLKKSYGIETLPLADLSRAQVSKALEIGRPQIRIYWLKHKLSQQRMRNVIALFRSALALDFVQNLIVIAPKMIRPYLGALFKLDHNMFLVDKYIENIESVLLAPIDRRLTVFLNEYGKISNNNGVINESKQFLETMARLAPDMQLWNSLKTTVGNEIARHESQLPTVQNGISAPLGLSKEAAAKYDPRITPFAANNFRELAAQMIEAEGAIQRDGFISANDQPTLYHYALTTAALGATTTATAIWKWDAIVTWYSAIIASVSGG